jgi:hypothetical protein
MTAAPIADPPWEDVWTLTTHALAVRGTAWLETWMWRWRFSGWILGLDEDATCTVCGAPLPTLHARRTSCSRACRQARVRARAAEQATEWEQQVASARSTREQLASELENARRWNARMTVFGRTPAFVPPDWTAMRHAPDLPARCGAPCESGFEGCRHTGASCLFASCGRSD